MKRARSAISQIAKSAGAAGARRTHSSSSVSEEESKALQQDHRHPDSQKLVGAHVSIAKGAKNAIANALKIGARAFAMDTKSKRSWAFKPLTDDACDEFKSAMAAAGYAPHVVLPHGSYLMNLGSPRAEILSKSRACLLEEMDRCRRLGLLYYNFHPGSSCGEISTEECIRLICESIDEGHRSVPGVVTVIENTAGQGNTIGGRFEELRAIIDGVQDKERMGVCLDTCHAFASGYDVRSDFRGVIAEFDRVVGLKYLRGLHVNDSKADLGSRRDLHENIGKGLIGLECFRQLMNDERLSGLPLILETPAPAGWETDQGEIDLLYSLEGKLQPMPVHLPVPAKDKAKTKGKAKAKAGTKGKAAVAVAVAAASSDSSSSSSESESESASDEDERPTKRVRRAASGSRKGTGKGKGRASSKASRSGKR